MSTPAPNPSCDDIARELTARCDALQKAAQLAWWNATQAALLLDPEVAAQGLEHYRAARALQIAAEEALLAHIGKRADL